MKTAVNVLDATTAATAGAVLVVSADIETWLSIILTCISICTLIITGILRVISLIKSFKSDDSDGGSSITKDEASQIVDSIKDTIDDVKDATKGDQNGQD